MSLKKIKIIGIVVLLILSFPLHYAYEIFPNSVSSIFFPVNESVWEHMKILFTGVMIWSFLEYIMIKRNKIEVNNFLFSSFFSAFISIPIFLIIFLPIYSFLGHNLIVTLIIMAITFTIIEYISYLILNSQHFKYLNIISLVLIIISYIVFGYLTYNPFKNDLFFDKEENRYGINIYMIGK